MHTLMNQWALQNHAMHSLQVAQCRDQTTQSLRTRASRFFPPMQRTYIAQVNAHHKQHRPNGSNSFAVTKYEAGSQYD